MSDLVEFLRARLDEVAELAQAVHGPEDAPWWSAEDIKTRLCDDQIWMHDAEHMAHHSPAFVLADNDAKRQQIDDHQPARPQYMPHQTRGCLTCTTAQAWDDLANEANCRTLRLLALPYAAHPEYREGWRP